MKQDLPWSVSGIPPEARDVARAAAGRDGLSVGDWITRRILTETARTLSASDRGTPVTQLAYKNERDDETRRDRDDLVQRLAKTEAETDGAFRRIDETLRAMGRRMETTERSQNEAQRTMSAAAAEISTATREQSQAFDHLNQRIERVERQSDNSALSDAVRGLHQGLSRLADQIAKTATESSNQVGTIAANVEALAGKVSQVRDEANLGAQVVDGRINALAERMRVTEERQVAGEPRATEIEHVAQIVKSLEKTVEGIAENGWPGARSFPTTVARVETRVDSAEDRMQDAMGRHLAAIERNLAAIGERLDQSEAKRSDAEEAIQESTKTLGARIDSGETHTHDAIADLKTQLGDATKRIDNIESGRKPDGALCRGACLCRGAFAAGNASGASAWRFRPAAVRRCPALPERQLHLAPRRRLRAAAFARLGRCLCPARRVDDTARSAGLPRRRAPRGAGLNHSRRHAHRTRAAGHHAFGNHRLADRRTPQAAADRRCRGAGAARGCRGNPDHAQFRRSPAPPGPAQERHRQFRAERRSHRPDRPGTCDAGPCAETTIPLLRQKTKSRAISRRSNP